MIVIARNSGPFYEDFKGNKERRGLIEGKVYDVIQWAYQDHSISPGHWVTRTDNFSNPKEAKFFIKVINEDGIAHDYWNDYFLSSEEMRDYRIDNILK